ncbi:MAG: tRNA uridine-5-carboxymethylaminomethyl(34) synthesis GTPase MnmE, partial [Candidatus Dadabacteria bacterium]
MSLRNDTIAALVTAPVPSGVAIVRVSGLRTKEALRAVFQSKQDPIEHPRMLIYGTLVDVTSREIIDKALAVYMPAPHSYTGEDVVEFQYHGSPLITEKLLRSLFAFGVVAAEPGEFTQRAFLNGRIDLAQAEAVYDLVTASSERALKIALDQLEGRLSKAVEKLGEPLRDLLAEIEAAVDFPEEELSVKSLDQFNEILNTVKKEINNLLGTYQYGSAVKEGFRVLLTGPPNSGKSSLLNVLLERERAIVTELSGTTRDLIEEVWHYRGFKFVICDSAGLRKPEDKVEEIGIELAQSKLSWADLVLFVVDAVDKERKWEKDLERIRQKCRQIWMVINKIDLNTEAIGELYCPSGICTRNFYLSVKTKEGLSALKDALVEEVKNSLRVDAQD